MIFFQLIIFIQIFGLERFVGRVGHFRQQRG